MKPPVDAPTSSADAARRVDLEGVERGRELVPAAADVRLGRHDRERRVRRQQVAGLPVVARRVALADADLAAEHERLGAGPRFDKAALDEQLVEPLTRRLVGGCGAHLRIVAQPAAPGLTPTTCPTGAGNAAMAGRRTPITQPMSPAATVVPSSSVGVQARSPSARSDRP